MRRRLRLCTWRPWPCWRGPEILLTVLILVLNAIVVNTNLIVYMDVSMTGTLKMVTFCVDCPSPAEEGGFIYALPSKHLVDRNFDPVSGILIYTIPNYAEKEKVINRFAMKGRIAFVERGLVSLYDKVLRIQQQADGVLGVIIADDGQCDEGFTFCGPRAGSVLDGGFSNHDDKHLWDRINIPVLLVTHASAVRLRKLMDIKALSIPRLSPQNATLVKDDFGVYEEL